MPSDVSWSDIFGRDVSFSQKITDSWNKYFGEEESESEDSTEEEDESKEVVANDPVEGKDKLIVSGGGSLKWSPSANKSSRDFPEPPEPPEDAPTVEISIYRSPKVSKGIEEVARDYILAAYRHSFGDRYKFEVTTHEAPKWADKYDEWKRIDHQNLPGASKDVNLLLGWGGWSFGGGDSAAHGQSSRMEDLIGKEPVMRGSGEKYSGIATLLHEVGHALGLRHRHGTTMQVDGSDGWFKTPMKGNYGGGNDFTFEFSPASIRKGLEVVDE